MGEYVDAVWPFRQNNARSVVIKVPSKNWTQPTALATVNGRKSSRLCPVFRRHQPTALATVNGRNSAMPTTACNEFEEASRNRCRVASGALGTTPASSHTLSLDGKCGSVVPIDSDR